MESILLKDIIQKPISGEWGLEDLYGTGIPVLRTANFTNEGIINFENVVTRNISPSKLKGKLLQKGDILLEKSGGSDRQPVGRVVYFDGQADKYGFNNFTSALRISDLTMWNPKYIFYALYANYHHGGTRKYENKTTGLHNLKVDLFIRSFSVPYATLIKQNEIVKKLDLLNHLENVCEVQLQKLDELIKSRFIEMFGMSEGIDKNLEDVADICSGITKGRKVLGLELREVPYMAVSNVKMGYIDLSTVKTIMATENEIKQYRLFPNDILMTEGGDPDKVGRGAIIRNPPKDCIHQNHIFRVRLHKDVLLPEFFEEYLQGNSARRYFLKAAKQTTGIASINMKQLRALPVKIPPIKVQIQYSDFVHQVDKSKYREAIFLYLLEDIRICCNI